MTENNLRTCELYTIRVRVFAIKDNINLCKPVMMRSTGKLITRPNKNQVSTKTVIILTVFICA